MGAFAYLNSSGRSFGIAALMGLFSIGSSAGQTASEGSQSVIREVLLEYCYDCHDSASKKGGLDLEALAAGPISDRAKLWETVVRRMDARQMPPPGKKRPEEKTYHAVLGELVRLLDEESAKRPDVAHSERLRRLTRTEYRNAIRDLLDLEVDVSELLPKDESSHGFDNITVSSLSATLLDRYVSAAQKLSRLAVGRAPGSAQLRVVRLPPDLTQEQHVEGMPLGTRGGALISHNFPVPGEYEIEVRLTRDRDEHVEGLRGSHELDVLLDRRQVARFTVKPPGDKDHDKVDKHLNVRVKVAGGPAALGVTFVNQGNSLETTKRKPYEAHFNRHRHPRLTPAVYQVSISGPYQAAPAEGTPSRDRLFGNKASETAKDEVARAEEIIGALLRRAYRRAVTAAELSRPMEFFRKGRAEGGGFEAGIERALSSILVSPRFLFRIERDPADTKPGDVYKIDDFALASRLSFFLWSSLPDDELLAVAERGELSRPEVLKLQTLRMLADPRASSLATNFAAQWLHLRNLDSITRDLRRFPDFDDNLRQSFRRETELFFERIVREDREITDLLDAKDSFLNERLAKHYGIPHVYGSRFRRVNLPAESRRGGLLRHGSILSVTSYANRTSPVIRGNWVLENIIGTPTPPPPPDVPSLDQKVVLASLPIRERLAAHTADRSCAVCHKIIDPVGFALENFDAVGRWRESDDGRALDVRGGLPDGREFEGVAALETALLERPDLFARTLTEKLLIFALGRGIDYRDAPAVRAIVREAGESNYRFSALITAIVKSDPFTKRKCQ